MELTIERLLEIANEIPEDKWITGTWGSFRIDGCRCFTGHIAEKLGDIDGVSQITQDINILIESKCKVQSVSVTHVNDGEIAGYNQKTPKERIIVFLTDCLNNTVK